MLFDKLQQIDTMTLFNEYIKMVKLSTKQPYLLKENKEFYLKYNHYYNELLNRLEKI